MKVGVFDSGLGGLTIVDSISKFIDGIEIFYIADTKFAPYGEKSKEQILNHSFRVTNYLIEQHDIDILVVACNTATSAAIKELRNEFKSLIVIGTEPGLKPAINLTKSNKIGVLATPATLAGSKYQELLKTLSLNSNIEFFQQECPGLVSQIESGNIEHEKTYKMLDNWLKPMKEKQVDIIVLGCTHYPLISDIIKKILGDEIILIETGKAIAKRLKDLSIENNLKPACKNEVNLYYTGIISVDMVNKILEKYNNCGKVEIKEKDE